MHVLLIDDAAEIVMLFKIFLERYKNIHVSTRAERFDEVYTEVDWDQIDVVVVDQFLGNYDGKKILRWLSERHPEIRRLMLTADDHVDHAITSAQHVLIKPIDAGTLHSAIVGES